MTHKKRSPGIIRICLLFAIALTLAVPASAEWKEKVLYSLQAEPTPRLGWLAPRTPRVVAPLALCIAAPGVSSACQNQSGTKATLW